VGGLAKSVPVADAAFAQSLISTAKITSDEFKDGRFVATDQDEEPDYYVAKQGGAGKWIVLLALLILAGAAAAMYFVVFKNPDKNVVASGSDAAGPTLIEMDAAVAVASDAGTASPAGEPAEFLGALEAAFARFDRSGVEQLQAELEALPEGLDRAVNRARLHNALAQHELDAAALTPKEARRHNSAARKEAKKALKLANTALGVDKENELANATKADALRLGGSPSREVERWLRKAKKNSESQYVSAMLRIRDKRVRDALTELTALKTANSTPRILYRLAMLSYAEGNYPETTQYLQEILALDSEHEGATALSALVAEKTGDGDAATNGNGDGATNVNQGGEIDGGVSSDPPSNLTSNPPQTHKPLDDDYDALLARADKAAETGNCSQAVKTYEKALNANPSGVAALTGLGFCHLDFKNYSSAQARFRAALGISPRYQDALWGVAEGYQQQGLNDQAIKGYRKFIEEHPASRRADMAKRQIERLGGNPDGDAPKPPETPEPDPVTPESKPDTSGVPSPEPAATSTPDPAPKPDPSGVPAPEPAAPDSDS